MQKPRSIIYGDHVGIVSPGKKISASVIENAVEIIEKSGYRTILGKHVISEQNYFAGTDQERISDFQFMLDHSEVKMILCARGGYGSARIVDRLDFSEFKLHPKWIAGYSDITVFHSHLFNLGFESLHGIMPLDFNIEGKTTKPVEQLFKTASGYSPVYRLSGYHLNRKGKGIGELTGGNLSLICSLLGSKSEVDTLGKVLFIEEVGEDIYRIDRMMVTLKRAGKLDKLAGLMVGGLTDLSQGKPEFGKTAHEVIWEHVSVFNYPVVFEFPAGHFPENYPLIIGRVLKIEAGEEVVLKFEENDD